MVPSSSNCQNLPMNAKSHPWRRRWRGWRRWSPLLRSSSFSTAFDASPPSLHQSVTAGQESSMVTVAPPPPLPLPPPPTSVFISAATNSLFPLPPPPLLLVLIRLFPDSTTENAAVSNARLAFSRLHRRCRRRRVRFVPREVCMAMESWSGRQSGRPTEEAEVFRRE